MSCQSLLVDGVITGTICVYQSTGLSKCPGGTTYQLLCIRREIPGSASVYVGSFLDDEGPGSATLNVSGCTPVASEMSL